MLTFLIGLYIFAIDKYWRSLGAHKAKSAEAIQFISSNENEATDTKRRNSVFQLDEEILKSGYGTKLEPYNLPMASIEHPSDHEQPDPGARFSAVDADLPVRPRPPRRRSSPRKGATKAAKRAARLAPIVTYPPSYFWSPAAEADDEGEEEELHREHEAHVPGVGRTYKVPSTPLPWGSPTAGPAGRANLTGDRGCVGRTYKEPSPPSTQGSPVQVTVEPESDEVQLVLGDADARVGDLEADHVLARPAAWVVDLGDGHLDLALLGDDDESVKVKVESESDSDGGEAVEVNAESERDDEDGESVEGENRFGERPWGVPARDGEASQQGGGGGGARRAAGMGEDRGVQQAA